MLPKPCVHSLWIPRRSSIPPSKIGYSNSRNSYSNSTTNDTIFTRHPSNLAEYPGNGSILSICHSLALARHVRYHIDNLCFDCRLFADSETQHTLRDLYQRTHTVDSILVGILLASLGRRRVRLVAAQCRPPALESTHTHTCAYIELRPAPYPGRRRILDVNCIKGRNISCKWMPTCSFVSIVGCLSFGPMEPMFQ